MISLSNLLKQQFVVNLQAEKRIINSDERFKSVPPKVEVQDDVRDDAQKREEVIDGFLAGLVAEEVVVEPQITQEEILAQAQEEADAIIAKAKAEALTIADRAKREAELLCEQKKQEGYNSGLSLMQEEMAAKKNQLDADYRELEQHLQTDYNAKLETMEADVVDAIIMVFNKVFGIQFDDKRQILLHLVKNTLSGIDVGKEFHIRVSPANSKFIESHMDDIKEKVGNDVVIDVVNDMTLNAEACIIETDYGVYNCGIDMELSNLIKDIRSLCC